MAKKSQAEFLSPHSHPLQARNLQQPHAKLEGIGAEAAEGEAGKAGGPSALGTSALPQIPLPPRARATMVNTHGLNSSPSDYVA